MSSSKFNKVFCIGLHKTGTTSLHNFFLNLGIKSVHKTSWSKTPIPNEYLQKNRAFSDGGGHFWYDESEFCSNHEVRLLDETYPNSKFLLNTRPLKSWVVSKLLHAGWKEGIELQPPKIVTHEEWKYKSIDVVKKWITNRYKYHEKVKKYFEYRPDDILYIDITKDTDPAKKIINFLNLDKKISVVDEFNFIQKMLNIISFEKKYVLSDLPHENKNKGKATLKDREFCAEVYEIAISEMDKDIIQLA